MSTTLKRKFANCKSYQNDTDSGYQWEMGYGGAWEQSTDLDKWLFDEKIQSSRKPIKQNRKSVRLGMIRHLYIILDCSESMLNEDLRPTRQLCVYKVMCDFVREFLGENPISQIGVIVTRNRLAEKLTEFSGNVNKHLESLEKFKDLSYCKGEPSLQNALEIAIAAMKSLPSHSSREILLINSGLTTCDPGNVMETIKQVKSQGIKSTIIGLSAEIHILKVLAVETGGEYNVCLNDVHFQELALNYVKPRSEVNSTEASCVKMGFPRQTDKQHPFIMCMCHPDDSSKLNKPGYLCPQCRSKYCELPAECKVCGITLITSAHLVRPLHFLLPIDEFEESQHRESTRCHACRKSITIQQYVYVCKRCTKQFCAECDVYIHEKLHVCPGCALPTKPKNKM